MQDTQKKCPICDRYFKARGLNTHLYYCSKRKQSNSDSGKVVLFFESKPNIKKIINLASEILGKVLVGTTILFTIAFSILLFQNALSQIKYYYLVAFLVLLLMALSLGFISATFGKSKQKVGSKNWWLIVFRISIQDLRSEILGAAITFVFLGVAIDAGTANENEYQRKQFLEQQLSSSNSLIAQTAYDELVFMRWLYDGSLEYSSLSNANLDGLDFSDANLHRASLSNANLIGTGFDSAILTQVSFRNANACGTNFRLANLQKADFEGANLSYANFELADLQGVDLTNANLKGASFLFTEFDTRTILPDGSNWSDDTNISLYTGDSFKLTEDQIGWLCH